MASEDQVGYCILRNLQDSNWLVVHYHPPGGQAALPIHLAGGRVIYLDLIATKGDSVLLMENKPAFDQADVDKLLTVADDGDAVRQVIDAVRRALRGAGRSPIRSPCVVLGHGFDGRGGQSHHERVNLVWLDERGTVIVTPSVENPLVI